MNNLELLLLATWLLMALSGVFAYKSVLAIKNHLDVMRRRKQYPSVGPMEKSQLCKGPHTWDRIKLALTGLPVDTYRVCTTCGFISEEGEDLRKLNSAGLEVYRNNIKIREENKRKWELTLVQKQEGTRAIRNKMIKSHVELLGSDLHANIKVLESFFDKSSYDLESLLIELSEADKDETGG